ncbi:hypothetical protein NECAME_03636 [Necator americanus]|uniref:SCP domain-containing protein n=1 Tax=Necator americanus TaxID=51031 RepID=W2T1U8_NECAM|nr:hypothetical protein NECAME_03636 [Necator americanus]ETN75863.1 hypothetical protein NECAME_03636 [Necator americanus]
MIKSVSHAWQTLSIKVKPESYIMAQAFLTARYGQHSVEVIKLTGGSTTDQETTTKNEQTTGATNSEHLDCGTVMSMKSRLNLLYRHNKHRSFAAKGEYEITTENDKFIKLSPAKRMPQLTATKPWADEIAKYGLSAMNEYRSDIGHATKVLWAETLTVGCGITHCSNGWIMVVCQYYPPGNHIGSSMYKEGTTLSECGPEGRQEIPLLKLGYGRIAHAFQKYNCSLEISSLKWANIAQCEMKHSTYPGVGENLFATSGDVTQEEAADTATKPWADEIANYGISAMNEYRSAIGHATQRKLHWFIDVQRRKNIVGVRFRRKKRGPSF